MSANSLRTAPTPGSPVVLGGTTPRSAAGRTIRAHLTPSGDHIDRWARQVRDAHGRVHIMVGKGFEPGHGYHYITECALLLWVGDGALLSTWPATCPACREAA